MNEHRGEFLALALVFSVLLHIGLMIFFRPRVMTQVVNDATRAAHRPPMSFVRDESERTEPVSMDMVENVEAKTQAPVAEADKPEMPATDAPSAAPETRAVDAPVVAPVAELPQVPEAPAPETFAVEAINIDEHLSAAIPVVKMAAPKVDAASVAPTIASDAILPVAAPALGTAAPLPAIADVPGDPAAALAPVIEKAKPVVPFVPIAEVVEKVDEQLVEREKAAVSDLLNVADATELRRFVNVQMTAQTTSDGWTYFKVMVLPRQDLPTVPKDVVVLIDASGSIGAERIGSIRGAAKRILRSATNSGDRFNLVAFRDRYSYAFRTWQECTQDAFNNADRWLSNVAAHGRTDVFATIRSVLTLPRDPTRPLIALVVTDGDANSGVRETADILSRFTALNDGLISVYMYGVKASANRELIDVLTHGNRGESFIFEGSRWSAGNGIEGLSDRFRDPVLSDLRIVFASGTRAEAYPRMLRNLYRGGMLELYGRVPAGTPEVSFSLRGLNGRESYEGFFKLPLATAPADMTVAGQWNAERALDAKLHSK